MNNLKHIDHSKYIIDNIKYINYDCINPNVKTKEYKVNNHDDILSNDKFASNYNIMIQSGVITDSFIELHIPYNPQLNYSIINECEGMKEEGISNDQILKCIDDIYIILLDSINVGELEWVFESHSYIKRKGFFTVIDISNLKKGRHDLIIHSNPKYSLNDKFDIGRGLMAGWRNARFKKEIPFYYYPKQ